MQAQQLEAQQVVKEFSCPQMDVLETTAQKVLMHCGVGSGKSFDMGVLSADFAAKNPEVRGFIGANTYGQLTKSTLDRIFHVWANVYGWKRGTQFVVDRRPPESYKIIGEPLKDYENTICFNNGALIFLASLDNYKVIDGTEFGWALLDETKDTKEEAIKEVIIWRLRQHGMYISPTGAISKTLKPGYKGYTPLYIFTSPAKSRWLMEWFDLDEDAEEIEKTIYSKTDYYRKYSKERDQLVVIASTYHNEKNLSPGYIEKRIDDLGGDDGRIKMLIYGSPFGKTGGEYYHQYNRMKHVCKFEPWDDHPVHISFDFNTVPYMTATLWQMQLQPGGKYLVRCFDEFCLPNPKNNTPDLCDAIIEKYGPLMKKNGIFYYGDYSGKSNQTLSKEFQHQYQVIDAKFKGWGWMEASDRVIVNPLHVKRRPFMNKALGGKLPLEVQIHERCRELRGDFEFVKEGKEGDKHKKEVKNEETGGKYQEHGHTSDSADYFLCSSFYDLFNN